MPDTLSVSELLDTLDIVELDEVKCNCDLFKFSSLTGEGLYAIGEWLNKTLFHHKERLITNTEIRATILFKNDVILSEGIFVNNPNLILLTAFRELRRKARIFSQAMRLNETGEEVVDLANYKAVFVKEGQYSICFLIGFNNPVLRTFDIAKKIIQFTSKFKDQIPDVRKFIYDLYPLDLPKKGSY